MGGSDKCSTYTKLQYNILPEFFIGRAPATSALLADLGFGFNEDGQLRCLDTNQPVSVYTYVLYFIEYNVHTSIVRT